MSPLTAIDTAQSLGMTLRLEGPEVRCTGPVNQETAAMLAVLREIRSDVALLLGDVEWCELLHLGVDEELAYSAVERAAIMAADSVGPVS